MEQVKLIDVNAENVAEYGFFCIKNKKKEGYLRKMEWLQERFQNGLKIKLLEKEDGKMAGFIEYTPGEYSWRPVEARDYYFIHCIMIDKKDNREKGWGSMLVKACVEDARKEGKLGVAYVASDGAWLADKSLFLRNGFEKIDQKDRYDLMVKPFKKGPLPKFKDWEKQRKKYRGWNLVYANQCPWHEKSVSDVLNAALDQGIDLKVTELKTAEEAQNGPCGFGVYCLIRDGEVLAEHYISRTRFLNILRKRGG